MTRSTPKASTKSSAAASRSRSIKRSFPYFRGFLSLKEGITRLDVALNDEEVPVLRIVYVKSMWDDAKIWNELLNAKVWPVKYKDGTLKDEEPKFTFKTEGHTL